MCNNLTKKILPAMMLAMHIQGLVRACIVGNDSRPKALEVKKEALWS
jgi:hypothetical protein